jgi:tetratricopeptide (TPR) repeat protein
MIMRSLMMVAALIAAPSIAMAVGTESDTPPTPTETTKTCANGAVWDAATETCVEPTDSSLNDNDRMKAVRELAYAGRIKDAERVLDAMVLQNSDGVLTYRGFTARQAGRTDEAYEWYERALNENPDNLLARAYLGQWHVESGNIELARAQLSEIRQRGGRSTWPELSLRMAIQSGAGYSY